MAHTAYTVREHTSNMCTGQWTGKPYIIWSPNKGNKNGNDYCVRGHHFCKHQGAEYWDTRDHWPGGPDSPIVQFRIKSHYSGGCYGPVHKEMSVRGDGTCYDTECAVASLDTHGVGDCPSGEVQISYWEKPGCTGKWYGYGYTSTNTCRDLWTHGYKWKAIHLRCARKHDDCVSKGTCSYDPEPETIAC